MFYRYRTKSLFSIFLVLPLLLFIMPTTVALAGCPSGMSQCPKGSWGPGGCYKPTYANCYSGRICSAGMQACAPGKYGAGGCFKPVYASCNAGLICSSGMQPCIRPGKPPKCYKPNYGRCN